MRKFLLAAAMATGLVVIWAALLPLTAQPAPAATLTSSGTVSKALFLCRGPNGIDRTCAAALAKALVLEAAADTSSPTRVSDQSCRVDRQMLASLDRRD